MWRSLDNFIATRPRTGIQTCDAARQTLITSQEKSSHLIWVSLDIVQLACVKNNLIENIYACVRVMNWQNFCKVGDLDRWQFIMGNYTLTLVVPVDLMKYNRQFWLISYGLHNKFIKIHEQSKRVHHQVIMWVNAYYWLDQNEWNLEIYIKTKMLFSTIIWTNVHFLLILFLGTNFSEILIKIYQFAYKMHLKMLSAKW